MIRRPEEKIERLKCPEAESEWHEKAKKLAERLELIFLLELINRESSGIFHMNSRIIGPSDSDETEN